MTGIFIEDLNIFSNFYEDDLYLLPPHENYDAFDIIQVRHEFYIKLMDSERNEDNWERLYDAQLNISIDECLRIRFGQYDLRRIAACIYNNPLVQNSDYRTAADIKTLLDNHKKQKTFSFEQNEANVNPHWDAFISGAIK